ncbi:MAG: glycosyltransferase family 39 protein [Nanoarchaeota archaeon]
MKKNHVFLIIILLVNIIPTMYSINQPFRGDENVFVEAAKGVLKEGKPIYDHSLLKPNSQALWHPPLYIYLISLFIWIFGMSIYSIRAVSFMFNILTIILVYLISKEIFKGEKNSEKLSLLATFIYALNPLTIQSSVIIDIDGGILNFFMYLFLYFFIKEKSYLYLIPSLLLVFLSKESGPIILFGSLLLFDLIKRDWKSLWKDILLFFVVLILFIDIFLIYTGFFNLDFLMPFKHNFSFLFNNQTISQGNFNWINSLWSLKSFAYFSIPFFIVLFLILSFIFYYRLIKEEKFTKKEMNQKESNMLLLNIISILTIGLFFYLGANAWGFPKYYILSLPGMSIFVIYMLSKLNFFKRINRKDSLKIIIISILFLAYFFFIVKDPLIPEFDSTSKNTNIEEIIFPVMKNFVLYFIIPLLTGFFMFCLLKSDYKILFLLLTLTIITSVYIDLVHTQVRYSTYIRYGETGVLETVKYIKDNNISSRNIATYPNIGSYIGMPNYTEIMWVYRNHEEFIEEIIKNEKIEYIIIFERDIERIGKENMDYFKLKEKIGSYYIFNKKVDL